MRKLSNIALATGVFFFASVNAVLADAGTPLIWASLFQLVIGNLFIGIGEGYLLIWRYKTKPSLSLAVMILANYVSSWVGYYIIGCQAFGKTMMRAISNDAGPLHYSIFGELVALIALYLFTIIIEWPFCYWIQRGNDTFYLKQENLIKKSLKASVFLQSASYTVVIVIFFWLRILGSGW